ncbi:MAG: hypothetical protein C0609_04775 [Deltaproteobacteria bacterium]|nr:MAG: hypothetical protein C0609_04775 [Deltaproteobacteria bacterium]
MLSSDWGVDPDPVRDSWGAIGAFRLMQALGAYAKLGGRFKKAGFIEHIPAGLRHLAHQLARADGDYPILSALVERSLLCPVVRNP